MSTTNVMGFLSGGGGIPREMRDFREGGGVGGEVEIVNLDHKLTESRLMEF